VSDAAHARTIRAPPFLDPPGYARHRPESTLLYQLVEQHYPAFRDLRSEAGRPLPDYVKVEFEAYLQCGRLEEGFLRVRCEHCHAEKHVAMNWARRLKRVFGIEIERCARCGCKLKIIASIEEPQVIAKILSHLQCTAPEQHQAELPLGARAPPMQSPLL
jgi:hypothetical protein